MKKSYQWNVGTITIQPPEGAPEGCPPCVLQIGSVTVTWGEDEPIQETDWVGFRQAIVQSAAFKRIASADFVEFTLLNSVMWLVATDPSKAIETAQSWNRLANVAQPTADEVLELNGIASQFHVPFQLNEFGLMS